MKKDEIELVEEIKALREEIARLRSELVLKATPQYIPMPYPVPQMPVYPYQPWQPPWQQPYYPYYPTWTGVAPLTVGKCVAPLTIGVGTVNDG